MAYLVLARKWRPQSFKDVVAQDHVTSTLVKAIAANRVAHAFLFAGPRGVGKTTTARILARALNCEKGTSPEPCGECSHCKSIADGTDLDVVEMDAATRTGVDDIRSLNESVKYGPSASRFRIFIIDEVHMLSTGAFNALLKTLEEPPGHVKFIFATTAAHKIPQTVLSRCQRYDFKRIPVAVIVAHLKRIAGEEGIGLSDRAAFALAREADGSMRDAQSLLDQAIVFARSKEIDEEGIREALGIGNRKLLFQVVRALVERDGAFCLQAVGEIDANGYDIPRFCQELVALARDLAVARLFADRSLLSDLSDEEAEEVARLAQKRPPEDLQRMFRLMSVGAEEVARSSFPKLLLEMTLLKIVAMPVAEPVAELIGRLEELEKRLGGGGGGRGSGGLAAAARPGGAVPSGGAFESAAEGSVGGRALVVAAAAQPTQQRPASGLPAAKAGKEHNRDAEALLVQVRRADKGLALVLAACEIEFSGEGVLFVRACSQPHFRELTDPGRQEKLASLARQALGREVSVRVLEPRSDLQKKERQEEKEAERERVRSAAKRAREHPAVKAALSVLGGEISEINVGRQRP